MSYNIHLSSSPGGRRGAFDHSRRKKVAKSRTVSEEKRGGRGPALRKASSPSSGSVEPRTKGGGSVEKERRKQYGESGDQCKSATRSCEEERSSPRSSVIETQSR